MNLKLKANKILKSMDYLLKNIIMKKNEKNTKENKRFLSEV